MEKQNDLAIVDEIHNHKTKIIHRKFNATLENCDVVANLKKLHCNFVFLPIDKAANNLPIFCKSINTLL